MVEGPAGCRDVHHHLAHRVDRLSRCLDTCDRRVRSRFDRHELCQDGHGDARVVGRAEVDADGLTCPAPDAPFNWEAEVEIAPEDNTALEGLYMSKGMYCTQCEAEGFRKITYYPDRPDVMAPFTVRIEGDEKVILIPHSNIS